MQIHKVQIHKVWEAWHNFTLLLNVAARPGMAFFLHRRKPHLNDTLNPSESYFQTKHTRSSPYLESPNRTPLGVIPENNQICMSEDRPFSPKIQVQVRKECSEPIKFSGINPSKKPNIAPLSYSKSLWDEK